jgi:O-antigen ligase
LTTIWQDDTMIWLLGGYMWLFVHRPFEVWPALGAIQIERGYMLMMLIAWFVSPGKGMLPNCIHIALAVFTVTMATGWVISPYADMPGCTDVVENYFKVIVFYVLVITSVRDERGLRLLVLLFLGSVGLYMAHSIVEFLHGKYQWRMGTRRMIGVDVTFSDPNAFASTLLYTLPLLIPYWKEQPRRIPRILLIGYALVCICCVLLTGSRAGFLGLCGLTAVILVSYAQRKGQMILLGCVAGLAAFAVLTVVLPEDLQNRYLTLVDSSRGPRNAQVSAHGRLVGLEEGIRVWQESPFFGHGPASFQYSTGKRFQAHNLYGQVLAELGLMGALSLLLLAICFARNWLESRRWAMCWGERTPSFATLVSQAIGINLILLLVMGWAGHNLYRYNWQWFAAFGAIALHCLRQRAIPVSQSENVAPYPEVAYAG